MGQLVLVLLLFTSAACMHYEDQDELLVMTFNIWQTGINVDQGFEKIVAHIKHLNPDVVALQEVSDETAFLKLVKALGSDWSGVALKASYPDAAIVTRHKLLKDTASQTSRAVGVQIKLNGSSRVFHIWSLHLDWKSYGPYAAYNKLVTDEDQIMAGEMGRFTNMRELLTNDKFLDSVSKVDVVPLLVCGDFNAPSHLDWTAKTRDVHGGWKFDWPATKMLQEQTGLVDSFREMNPDVMLNPGVTWSTVEKMSNTGWNWTIPEPQDRIDFIFYRGRSLQATASHTYQGTKFVSPKPFHRTNDYPSDHFAVLTKFSFQ